VSRNTTHLQSCNLIHIERFYVVSLKFADKFTCVAFVETSYLF